MVTDEQIAMAFNAGYTMQQIDPKMVEKLLSQKSDNELVQAMAKGAEKQEREKIAKQQQAIRERAKNRSHKR